MIITCENCATRFTLDESLLNPEGSKVRCSQCRHIFIATPPAPKAEEIAPATPEEMDFNTSQDKDASGGDLDFDSEFEAMDFDQDLGFDDPEPVLEDRQDSPSEHAGDAKTEDMAFSAEAVEFEIPDVEIQEDQDDALAFETGDDAEKDDFPELEMHDLPDTESDDLESIEFEDLTPEAASDPDHEADIEISFDKDDTAQDLPALSLEMNSAFQEEPDELDLESEDISLEAEDFDLEPEDDAPMDMAWAQDAQAHDDFEMAGAGENDQKVQDDDLLEPDLELSFDDDLAVEEDTTPEIDLDLDDDDGSDAMNGQNLEDKKFAGYDEVLEQDTEPEQDVPEPDEALDDPSPPPEAQPAPAVVPPEASQADPLITPPPKSRRGKHRIKKKKSGLGAPVKILVLVFFLVIAAYLITLRLGIQIPFMDQMNIPYITQAFKPAPPPIAATGPIPNDAATTGKFVTNDTAGRLFIITGKVDNPDKIAYSNIRLRGTLLTKGNKKAATQVVYCGNVIANEDLKSKKMADITKQLSAKQGMQNTNINVRPGTSVHFMLVFSNLPENLSNFTVEVLDYKPASPQ